MVTIVFPDRETEKRALGFLLGRFSGRVLRSGEHLVPEAALEALADQNISFTVKGKATFFPGFPGTLQSRAVRGIVGRTPENPHHEDRSRRNFFLVRCRMYRSHDRHELAQHARRSAIEAVCP